MSEVQSYKTFAITIRPKDGVSDQHVDKTMKWCRKHALYYHVITEKTGSQRHIHAGVFLNKEKKKNDVCIMLCGLFKDLTAEEKSVLRKGVKIMYNWDFIDNYLDKDDDTCVVGSNLPEERHIEGYFPPKPLEKKEGSARKCSLYYHELERMWYEHRNPAFEVTTVTTRDFLFEMMYDKRILPVIRDDKQIIQVSRHLTRWLNKVTSSSIELPVFEKEE